MSSCVDTGILRGRPFGGVAVMIKNNLRKFTQLICAAERYVVVKVSNYVLSNLYLPCSGTVNRRLIIEEVFIEIEEYLKQYTSCKLLIGGDFNCDLDADDSLSVMVSSFLNNFNLRRCDLASGCYKVFTYSNDALGYYSCIDFVLMSDISSLCRHRVVESGSNLSDHSPVLVEFTCDIVSSISQSNNNSNKRQRCLRWDKADLGKYYSITGELIQQLLVRFDENLSRCVVDHNSAISFINVMYNELVDILCTSAEQTVPIKSKDFYKFWWSEELNVLKDNSIRDHCIWKEAGRPRSGPIFKAYRTSKLLYKKRIRDSERQELSVYTNDLHEALLKKQGPVFWKCWKSKFEHNNSRDYLIDGTSNHEEILDKFVDYFKRIGCNNSVLGNRALYDKYVSKRENYTGNFYSTVLEFDIALIESVIANMQRGKAPGLDGLTSEHLRFSHPAICQILLKLFNIMMDYGCVPDEFGLTYTIPLLKSSYSTQNKALSFDDFRGISISQVISKVFERCILNRYEKYFFTSDNQYGFKYGLSCSHAIYAVKSVVNLYTSSGSTVNLCALDVKKAFDKMNHYGLFLKLMDRLVPVNFLSMLEYWLCLSATCVRWVDNYSEFFSVACGVRQGGVLSPYLFAIYVDDIIEKIKKSDLGCRLGVKQIAIILYADDILLLAPSVEALQKLFDIVEDELKALDMTLNTKKSVCVRFGPRYQSECYNLRSLNGDEISWVSTCRYLGVWLLASRNFKCDYSNSKKLFFRAVNSVFGKVLRVATEDTILHLISSKCMPILLYGLNVCPIGLSDMRSLDFVQTRLLMKLFNTGSVNVINECRNMFGIKTVSDLVFDYKRRFLHKLLCSNDNVILRALCSIARRELDDLKLL